MSTNIPKKKLEAYLIDTRKLQSYKTHVWRPSPVIYTERSLNQFLENIQDNQQKGFKLTHVYTPLAFDEEMDNHGFYKTFLSEDYQSFISEVSTYSDQQLKDLILKCMTITSRRLILLEYRHEEQNVTLAKWLDMHQLNQRYLPPLSI